MSREFLTDDYENTWGRKPRGVGDWAFVPANYIWPSGQDGDWLPPYDSIAWAWGSYTDAKREVASKWPSVSAWRVLS